jgi:hypothetical protein
MSNINYEQSIETLIAKHKFQKDPMKDLEFNTGTIPTQAVIHGKIVPVQNSQTIFRTDNDHVLGIVGSNYKTIDHVDHVGYLTENLKKYSSNLMYRNEVINEGSKIKHSILLLDKGIFRNSEEFLIPTFENYYSYDGSRAHRSQIGGIRVICLNGMFAIDNKFSITIRHSKNIVNDQKSSLYDIEYMVNNYENNYTSFMNSLIELKPVKDDDLGKIEIPKKMVKGYLENTPEKTAWGQYNYFTHEISHNEKLNGLSKDLYSRQLYNYYAKLIKA